MAKSPAVGNTSANTIPDYPTMVKKRFKDGRVVGIDNSVWLYKMVPLSPVSEARTPGDAVAAGNAIQGAINELSRMATVRGKQRNLNQKNYRQIHLAIANVPTYYEPAHDNPIHDYLAQEYVGLTTFKRVLVFGVRLREQLGNGSFNSALESAWESIVSGGTPLSDFDIDFKAVDSVLTRAGMTSPTNLDFRYINGWWNYGNNSDVPVTYHDNHIHFFSSSATARIAEEEGLDDCEHWCDMEGTHAITFSAVESFDLPYVPVEDDAGRWASRLIESDALAISIRGLVEPPVITREVMRKQIVNYRSDLSERREKNKLDRAELDEKLGELDNVERAYSNPETAPATLIDTSVLVAMRGIVDDPNDTGAYQLSMSAMQNRQPGAWTEMMVASSIRVNPYLEDLPSTAIAYSGIPSLSNVGDKKGWALFGLTERDRQPSYLSHVAVSDEDVPPAFLVAAGSGSGKTMVLLNLADQQARAGVPNVIVDPKALTLDTELITPTGTVLMGDVKVGDRLIGRDGSPCNVTHLSRIFTQPDLYEFVLDDGQVIAADAEHQWVVYSAKDRARFNDKVWAGKVGAGDERAARRTALAAARAAVESDLLTVRKLHGAIISAGCNRWSSTAVLRRAISDLNIGPKDATSAAHLYSATEVLGALIAQAEDPSSGPHELTTRALIEQGVRTKAGQPNFAIPVTAELSLPEAVLPVPPYVLGAWLGDGTSKNMTIASGYEDVDEMLSLLSENWPTVTVNREGRCAVISLGRDKDLCLYGHDDYRSRRRPTSELATRYCGECVRLANSRRTEEVGIQPMTNPSLHHLLQGIGVLGNKHVPGVYLRASAHQRLQVLQGLMDTDGTVKKSNRSCSLTLTNRALAYGALELIRSLGIKATIAEEVAKIVEVDPENPGERRTRVTGPAYRIAFHTHLPVFRLKRKLALLPTEAAVRSKFHYIREIRPVASRPARCVRVDSADHTYLVAGFVPTHNTGSDHSASVLASGGQVISLDDLTSSDGALDALRFAASAAVGVDMAASALITVNPWGSRVKEFEVPLYTALGRGVALGATCTGQALQLAYNAEENPKYKAELQEMIEPLFRTAETSALFRSFFGINPKSQGLRVADGTTLIKVGDYRLELPSPGTKPELMSFPQRMAIATVKMMFTGSGMALTGRDGVLHQDEAWVVTGSTPEEAERAGRLARSQRFLPIFYSQDLTGAIEANLVNHVSRVAIGPLDDPVQARAALQIARLEATPERMSRITAKKSMGANGDDVAPNWHSLRPLYEPGTRRNLRGTIFIVSDLAGRAVPVEVKLSPGFLARASNNRTDVEARKLQG